MTRLERALLLTALLASPGAAARLPRPEPAALLDAALAEPATGYAGRVKVQYFPVGGAPKAQFREVRWDGPGRERVETFAKRRTPSAVRVRSGGEELVHSAPLKRAWKGPRPEPDAAQARRHRARLDALYELSVSTGGQTAKRKTWRLDLRSRADGRLRRSLWVDRDTAFVLKREDYRHDGSLRLRERFLRLSHGPQDPEAFRLDAPRGVSVTARETPFIPCPSAGRKTPCASPLLPLRLPGWLPEGYFLFDVLGSTRAHLITAFNDGLAPVSVAASAPDAAGPAGADARPYAVVTLGEGRGEFLRGADGPCLAWRAKDRQSVVCGDLAEDELARLADSMEPAR
ncbi:MAG: hypothetical protein SF051_07110 [Elusimicrobiota bacterium]|nr:hypothetical protein [Elusimicrobiota bacterium]